MMHNRVIGLEIAFRNQPITSKGYVMKKSQVALAVVSNDSTTALDNLSIVNSIGADLGLIHAKDKEILSLKENINQKIVVLFNRKVVIGRYSNTGKGCAYAIGFIDACVNAGIEKGTAQKVYLPTFKKAVESGKPVTDWNGYRKPTNSVPKEKVQFASKLMKAFMDAEFDGFVNDLQKAYHNDEIKSFKEGIVSYLEMMGEDISKKK
jgi:hypothetical protein